MLLTTMDWMNLDGPVLGLFNAVSMWIQFVLFWHLLSVTYSINAPNLWFKR